MNANSSPGGRGGLNRCGNIKGKKDLKTDGPDELEGINCSIRKVLSVT
jgi:hypothetical protein